MSAFEIIVAICLGVAVIAWLVALVSGLGMLRHRAEGYSRFWYMTHGIAFFYGRPFGPGAQPHFRRFRLAAAIFFGALLLAALAAIVLTDGEAVL